MRAAVLIAFGLLYVYADAVQGHVDETWKWLRADSVFLSVFFETWYTTIMYTVMVIIFMAMSVVPSLQKYKLEMGTRPKPKPLRYLRQFIVYVGPLCFLDAFTVKHYADVDASLLPPTRKMVFNWATTRQVHRILPVAAPSVGDILLHILLASILYDLFFCAVHYLGHTVPLLYRHMHRYHHDHKAGMLADVTGQLAAIENLADILLANLALKLVGAHPLTRVIYVPILLFLLCDNHSGFDFPIGYHRIVPWNLCGGSPAHYAHHQNGKDHYQPFFTYLSRSGLEKSHVMTAAT